MGSKFLKKEAMISSDIGKEVIKKELPLIPKLPGVYRMLNSDNEILYVGKAKNLPNRLKSYVSEKNHIIRTERMLSQTKKLEITTTTNESEALLLEANLIKKHKPKFNIEVNYEDKKPSNDKDLKTIVNYAKIVRLIKKLVKNKHYNFLETLAEDVFDELFKDKRIDKISLQIEKLEIMKDCSAVGIQISKKRSHVKS